MPRRAVFHRYPLVGRWAAFARREQYLWSFRRGPIRRALYAGSILSLLPLMGVQLPVGLVLSIVTRSNFMVLGALQLITNPFTALPIYGATFVLGRRLLRLIGHPMRGATLPQGWADMNLYEIVAEMDMGTAIGQGVICLMVGGFASGVALALLLDIAYLLGLRAATAAPKSIDVGGPPPVP